MSNYFREFPKIDYRFGDEVTTTRFQHLGTSVDMLDQIKELSVYYETYHIRNGLRPEQVSYELYKNVNYYWTFYLLNDHLRTNNWPIRDADLFPKVQAYYPNTVIVTTATTLEKAPKYVDGVGVVYYPTGEQLPMCKSKNFKAGNYLYFPNSKTAGKILKIDQRMGFVYTDAKNVSSNLDVTMEVISEEDALKVISDPNYEPVARMEEADIYKVYDEFDAPHHYENGNGDWVYPEMSATYPNPLDQNVGRLATLSSVSNFSNITSLNESQKIISVIKRSAIETVANELVVILRDG